MTIHFSDELEGDEIYFRDRWQFEQKYDFLPDSTSKKNEYTQEFYFFIPNALQVNNNSYTLDQFYKDQTNLIRFKTPVFTLREIADLKNLSSPLAKITKHINKEQNKKNQRVIENEIQLLGNIVRSAIRTEAQDLCSLLEEGNHEKFLSDCYKLCSSLEQYFEKFENLKKEVSDKWASPSIKEHFDYATLFLNQVINGYLIMLLERIRSSDGGGFDEIDKKVSKMITSIQEEMPNLEENHKGETTVYKKSLLNKFFVNALLLNINRFSPSQKYQNVVGAVAAGIAMLVFFSFYLLGRKFFLLNSAPFLLIMVVLYILKDRIKEGIKAITHYKRLGWVSDFTTKIKSPDNRHVLGVLTEKFSFINEEDIPEEIVNIRNREFHSVIESFKRPETVMYYKKRMTIFQKPKEMEARRFMLNIIFRFNIRHFMDKASNPYTPYLWLDRESNEITMKQLPKVYHLNIIINTTTKRPGKPPKEELSKVRIIADKSGIKRIEYP